MLLSIEIVIVAQSYIREWSKFPMAVHASYNSDQVAKYNKIIVASRESGGNQLGGMMYGGAVVSL